MSLGESREDVELATVSLGHAALRNRRLTSGILTSIVSRGVAAIVPLLLIPLTLSYLGEEVYGLWMAVMAVTAMAAFADLGLGNGLMTKLAPCYASGDVVEAKRLVSNAYAILVGAVALLLTVLWISGGIVPWSTLLNAENPPAADEARGLVLICISAFLLNIPLSLVQRVLYAYQRVAQANLWLTAGSLLSIPLVLAATWLDLGPQAVIAAAVAGPLLVNATNTLWQFRNRFRLISPRPGLVQRSAARTLLGLGSRFFAITVVTSLAVGADNLIVAHALGLGAVTTYAVPARVFAQIGILVSLINLPLWPANGEALARGDVAWVRRVTTRMTLLSGSALAVPSLVLVLFGDHLLETWLGSGFTGASTLLLAGLAVWWIMLASISPRFMVQNSVGVLGPQLVGWSLYLLISVPAKVFAADVGGLAAIPIVGVIVYATVVVPAAIWGYRRALAAAGPDPSGAATQAVLA